MYIRDDDSADMMNLTTNGMKQNFEDLRAGKTYEFQVRVSQYVFFFFVNSVELYYLIYYLFPSFFTELTRFTQ